MNFIKNFVVLILLALIPTVGISQKRKKRKADEATAQWRYDIESVAVGGAGTCLVKVWSYSASPKVAIDQAAKNAVHGVLFKGIPANGRIPARKPLVSNPQTEQEHAAFFEDFFKTGGPYMRYVTQTNSGTMDDGDIVKVDRREYKVGVNVSVNYSELRKALEEANIIKKLGSIF